MGSNVKVGRGSPGSPLTLSALLPLFICWSKLLIRKLQNIHLLTLLLMIEINGPNLMWQDCRMPPGKFAILATSRLPQSSAIICLVSRSYLVPLLRVGCLLFHPWGLPGPHPADNSMWEVTFENKRLRQCDSVGRTRHWHPVVLGLGQNCQAVMQIFFNTLNGPKKLPSTHFMGVADPWCSMFVQGHPTDPGFDSELPPSKVSIYY